MRQKNKHTTPLLYDCSVAPASNILSLSLYPRPRIFKQVGKKRGWNIEMISFLFPLFVTKKSVFWFVMSMFPWSLVFLFLYIVKHDKKDTAG